MNSRYKQKITEDVEEDQYCNQIEEQRIDNPVDNDQIDPLDQFMNALGAGSQKLERSAKPEIDEDVHSEFQSNEDNREQQEIMDEQQQSEQEMQKSKKQKKIIQSLPPFDFSKVQLRDFEKNFYQEHQQITELSVQKCAQIMEDFQIKVSGANAPRPIISFAHLPFDEHLKHLISKNEFQKPTPIQAIALPAILSGRDVVGIAKTGSGKTLAYVWPMIIHVSHQQRAYKNEGPAALILAPTRQLCQQIYLQTKKYSKKSDLKVACLLGGQNKHDQWKTLKSGVDILIASPGRLIEMIKKKATNLIRVTYLVLDEADRMLSLGFQQQIRSIVAQTRQDRQTLLFTATMKKSMQFLVGDIIQSPVRINIGNEGAANEDVKQQIAITPQRNDKFEWIRKHISSLLQEGKILIFANQRESCEQVGNYIKNTLGKNALVLHGDKSQYERTITMNAFKGDEDILVATDIAARGIDVKNIKNVINFECPKEIESYIHRIGRAGRAGVTGCATSLLSNSDIKFAMSLIKVFENSGYPVSSELEDFACLDDQFRRKRLSSKMGVSFAKGKDATKLLNHALQKQRKGYSRAGLGFQTGKTDHRSFKIKEQVDPNSLAQQINTQNLSISDISSLIRDKYSNKEKKQQKYGKFILSSQANDKKQQQHSTITYFNPKR